MKIQFLQYYLTFNIKSYNNIIKFNEALFYTNLYCFNNLLKKKKKRLQVNIINLEYNPEIPEYYDVLSMKDK